MEHPIITKIERQKKAAHRVSIFLNGEYAFGINDESVYTFGLSKGLELGPTLRKQIEDYDARVQAKLIAERFLAIRMRSEKEIRVQLRRKGFEEDVIDETIERLLTVGLIDDNAFVAAYVKDRVAFKPRSRSALERELASKGINDDVARHVIDSVLHPEDELILAKALAKKFLQKQSRHPHEVQQRRLTSFLLRRGFSYQFIRDILEKLIEEKEDGEKIES